MLFHLWFFPMKREIRIGWIILDHLQWGVSLGVFPNATYTMDAITGKVARMELCFS